MNSFRPILACLALGSLLAVSACGRTSDGSYELKDPPPMPAFLGGKNHASTSAQVSMNDYPRGGGAAGNWELKRKAARAEAWKPEPATAYRVPVRAAASAISCHDETQPGGRVKVVCD